MDYFEAFLITMQREWGSIDKHRLDKYLALIRYFFAAVFEYLFQEGLSSKLILQFTQILTKKATGPLAPNPKQIDVAHHVIELYLEELHKVVKDRISSETLDQFLSPFYEILTHSEDKVIKGKVEKMIFEPLIGAFVEKKDLEINPDAHYHSTSTLVERVTVEDQEMPVETTFLPFDLRSSLEKMRDLAKKTKANGSLNRIIQLGTDAVGREKKLKQKRKKKEKQRQLQSDPNSLKKFKAEKQTVSASEAPEPSGGEEDPMDYEPQIQSKEKKSSKTKKEAKNPPTSNHTNGTNQDQLNSSPKKIEKPEFNVPKKSKLQNFSKQLSKKKAQPLSDSKLNNDPSPKTSPSKNEQTPSPKKKKKAKNAPPADQFSVDSFLSPPAKKLNSTQGLHVPQSAPPKSNNIPANRVSFNLARNSEKLFVKTQRLPPTPPPSSEKKPAKSILRTTPLANTIPHLDWKEFFN